ncbi:MAG: gliding motility-associated ABC transporter permease subunit GldF [Chitinophagales bacterium]
MNLTIFKKEINQFFSSLVGYIAIIIFLVFTGLISFVFPNSSVLSQGFANLNVYFELAPLLFLFLIPAITMRLFSEEFNKGTIELLSTKPLSENNIVLGKYFAALVLVIFSVLPTLIYFYTVYKLGAPEGNLDFGGIMGSYIGLILLGASFVAIGLFSSVVTKNQILAFLLAALLCYVFYLGFDQIASLPFSFGKFDYFIERLGINSHYNSMSRGVIDTRDVLYFISLISIFILLTKFVLSKKK